ncbi:hypothetical protein, partial [Ralstonia pseudosolanacearum]|uniref:hypothetical protein n=1 Tax=Ralstonia pseudosolanacearum TaxID=1310165 RepID=UPI003CF3FBA7
RDTTDFQHTCLLRRPSDIGPDDHSGSLSAGCAWTKSRFVLRPGISAASNRRLRQGPSLATAAPPGRACGDPRSVVYVSSHAFGQTQDSIKRNSVRRKIH